MMPSAGRSKAQRHLEGALHTLAGTAARVRRLGVTAAILTMLNVAVGFSLVFPFWRYYSILTLGVSAVLLLIMVAAVLVRFEQHRRDLDLLRSEIADLVQDMLPRDGDSEGWWSARIGSGSDEAATDPVAAGRRAIRYSASVEDLPLVPGRFGPAAYIGIHLLLVVLSGLRVNAYLS